MKIIDSDNYAAAGIETMFFPGGEPHVKIPRFDEELLLYLKLRTWADVGFAACLINAVDIQRTFHRIFIPYFPGARQDRSDGTAPLTVAIMSKLLEGHIHVFDPHSDVLGWSIDYTEHMPSDLKIPINTEVCGIIAPDEGATERASDFLDAFYPKADLIQGYKERDSRTGALSNYTLEKLDTAGTYIIVDDICDGGGTFNLLVEAFDKDPLASKCNLEMFVSHGIFSKGLSNISPRIRKITTTDSWCLSGRPDIANRLTILPLLPQLLPLILGD